MEHQNPLEIAVENEIVLQDDDQHEGDTAAATERTSGVSRRRFLFAGAGAVATIAAGPAVVKAQRQSSSSPVERGASATAMTDAPLNQFMQPPKLFSQGGTLAVTLNAIWKPLGNPVIASVPTYNGYVTGPTLVINPGDQMQIMLNNNLQTALYTPQPYPFTADQCGHHMSTTPPKPECFTHTNLHTHGLLVSPSSVLTDGTSHCIDQGVCGPIDSTQIKCGSDDVLAEIAVGGSILYQIFVPGFHDPGTYWYHSHLHGSAGYQVSSGMAGAIIIQEPPDQQLVPPQQDFVFLMQEVVSGGDETGFPKVYGILGGGGDKPPAFFYINGLRQPTIQMQAGQTQRWRFINATATPQGLTKLRLISCGTGSCPNPPPAVGNSSDVFMNLIAVDGISFTGFPPQPVRAHLMGPGNRADFLINLPAGNYVLYKDAFPQDATCIKSPTTVRASAASTQVLAHINVQPSSYTETLPSPIPGTKPFYLQPITYVDSTREDPVKFQVNRPKREFKINGQFYQPDDKKPITAQLNTAEQWTLDNSEGENTHPFHIHLNPFQIKGRTIDFETDSPTLDPDDPCNWMWMDTVALPMPLAMNTPNAECQKLIDKQSSNGGQLKMRTRFLVYPGEYVIHCHILVHEDVGMMKNVRINNDGTGIGPCVPLSQPTPNAVACVQRTTKPC